MHVPKPRKRGEQNAHWQPPSGERTNCFEVDNSSPPGAILHWGHCCSWDDVSPPSEIAELGSAARGIPQGRHSPPTFGREVTDGNTGRFLVVKGLACPSVRECHSIDVAAAVTSVRRAAWRRSARHRSETGAARTPQQALRLGERTRHRSAARGLPPRSHP